MKKRDVYNWSRRQMRGDGEDVPQEPLWKQVLLLLVILGLCGLVMWVITLTP